VSGSYKFVLGLTEADIKLDDVCRWWLSKMLQPNSLPRIYQQTSEIRRDYDATNVEMQAA
jgi:hypothetical protein